MFRFTYRDSKRWDIVDEPYDLLFMNPGESPGSDWRYVMPGNWDPVQNIAANGRVEFPTGPLVLNALPGNDTPKWVDAWIVQSSTGSAQTYYGSASSGAFAVAGHWIANIRAYNRGKFLPGPAVGIALIYVKDGNNNEYIWWSEDPIELQ